MTSNKPRRYVGGTTEYITEDSSVTKPPQEAPVNGSESYIPILADLAKITAKLKQETMTVWRIDIPSGDCWATDRINKKNLPVPIAKLYAEGYRLFGVFGISGNTGWAYLTNWVEVE